MTERPLHLPQMGEHEYERPGQALVLALKKLANAGTKHEIAEGARISLTTLNRVLDGEVCMVETRAKLQAYVDARQT